MKKYIFFFSILFFCNYAQAQTGDKRYPILFNMVHHNPGEPLFETQYKEPAYLKTLGYNGQIPRFFVQCAITYDDWENNIVPEKSAEKIWIEREAATIRVQINNAEKAHIPLYPFTDILVLPKSVMNKYKEAMFKDGRLSILREKTQEIVRVQIAEIFKRFPKLAGLTIRHGETYLFDTPFHLGNSPAKTPEEHIVLINILREEICVKRNKKLFYRTWDFGEFHTNPAYYLKVTNAVEPHPLLYFSIKHTNNDFLRGVPFNTTVGIGNHQQIVEISTNQAGVYGRSSHPYYIGRGIIEGWSEMKDPKKGIRDLYNDPKIKGFWIWTWGDGWVGPYFDNELWINLNEFIIRSFAKNPKQKEVDIFEQYTRLHLKLTKEDGRKFRELCLLSEDAVYYGQASQYFYANAWWCRDQYLTAINLTQVVSAGIMEKVLAEKKINTAIWYKMEQLSKEIKLPNPDDQEFLRVSTTYGRIKYEVIEMIWQMQIMLAENKTGKHIDKEEIKKALSLYDQKWKEWEQLKKQHPSCPTLYSDDIAVNCGPPFQESVTLLKNSIEKNY
jgi:hypothetical protein